METVVTSAEMQACDRFAIQHLHIPGIVLMEHAGKGVVEVMTNYFGSLSGRSILILCGKGNNGGDGFVVGRHLANLGANVNLVLIGKISALKGDALTNCRIFKTLVHQNRTKQAIQFSEIQSVRKIGSLPKSEIIVDALFGTGFKGEVQGIYKNIIAWINKSSAKTVSIDVPSGIDADDGSVKGVAVEADVTVTMGLKKVGLVAGDGKHYAGAVEVVDIGIPKNVFEKYSGKVRIIEREDVARILPVRPVNANKYSVGKILVIAGSRGLTGAAAMTAVSAMRSGAGAVVLCTPSSVYPILSRKLTEVMVEPLPETPDGSLSMLAFGYLQKKASWADVVIIGPGLSKNPETQSLVRKLVGTIRKNLIIDADGLNAFSENKNSIRNHRSMNVIITPHAGELSRLINIPSSEIENQRVAISREVAKRFGLTLILKGAPTVTANEKGDVFINSTGNSGMATAGSGDVLTGCIGGLWGQGMERTDAARAGVYVHGLAGDFARKKLGTKGMMATDIQNFLPKALVEVENSLSV